MKRLMDSLLTDEYVLGLLTSFLGNDEWLDLSTQEKISFSNALKFSIETYYRKHFSDDEIIQLTEWYESDLGKKLLKHSRTSNSEILAVMSRQLST